LRIYTAQVIGSPSLHGGKYIFIYPKWIRFFLCQNYKPYVPQCIAAALQFQT